MSHNIAAEREELHQKHMMRAIELGAYAALERKSGGPFGAVIVQDGCIIAEGMNQVVETKDPTWHAEMAAIRAASQALQSFSLTGCILYTSSEPCPMCLAASYWAGIEKIYYASTVEDARLYGNFDDSFIYTEFVTDPSERRIPCIKTMRNSALEIWKEYAKLPDRVQY